MSNVLGNKLDIVIQKILGGNLRNVAILTGAGVSCASGIPDFRSPGGLYDTLKPELITATDQQRQKLRNDPTQVVSIDMFSENQFPYLEVRKPFILGTLKKIWKPTIAHYFLKLLHDKNLLRRIYTQNIDGLDSHLNIDDFVCYLHGTISKSSCEFCKHPCDHERFCDLVQKNIKNIYDVDDVLSPKASSPIYCDYCHLPGLKPNTVLYGTSLPDDFYDCLSVDFPANVDLLIIAGTSLTVYPAAGLVSLTSPTATRLLINRDAVGQDFRAEEGSSERGRELRLDDPTSSDLFLQGDCDEIFLDLVIKLGWIDNLYTYVDCMAPSSQTLLREAYARLGNRNGR